MTETGDDRYREWDGAYVLGALTPDERREYETHLAECPDCARAVTELAVLPGLLARVPEPDIAAAVSSPLPESLWRTLESVATTPAIDVRRVARRDRLRRVAIGVGSAVVAAAAAVAITVSLVHRPPPQVYGSRTMQLLVSAPVAADFTLTKVGEGSTFIKLNCGYTHGASAPAVTPYRLVVTSDSGVVKQVTRWYVKPGVQEYHPNGTVDLPPADIRTVAITDDTGHPLLVATV